ncbi:competence type IV pilus minor pilin ComGG [Streptococcus sp.]|uniref:competence type IV pilus minor pilin ComGG n=1 Tax=Streptococcus sp. TaxID=1306 RepID=UPI0026DC657D|nr:competence type IV pilus minor pilin ComGG [Streptococcus sp.]MDO4660262.1 competence type IV pilus minor pilin ComGG [Streptococcus sp.]
MWKKQKVKAGVLLYAVTMAAIFSLLLQFYLNRQVAYHKDFALNKEKLAAFAMAKRSKDKAEQESGERVFNLGKVKYQNTKTGFATSVRMNKGNYEFLFPPLKTQEKKTAKKEEVATDSSNQAGKKKSEGKPEKKDNS